MIKPITSMDSSFLEDCPFCRDLTHQNRIFRFCKEDFFNKICLESENFAAFPSLSPIGHGHSLIIPKTHVTSMAQIAKDQTSEIWEFLFEVRARLEDVFGPVVLFEHGIGFGKHGGCGVSHAHFHLLHISLEVIQRVKDAILSDFHFIQLTSITDLFNLKVTSDSYLLFDDINRNVYFAKAESVPSQYLRQIISQANGNTDWDWREYFGWDMFREAHIALSRQEDKKLDEKHPIPNLIY